MGDTNDKARRTTADPRTRRGRILHSLPKYSGPYSVGIVDFELPVEKPCTFAHITRKKHHLLQLETVLFTIFYPAAKEGSKEKDSFGKDDPTRETWLPRPRKQTAKGYARFSGIPSIFLLPFFLGTTWSTKIPARRNAKLAEHYPIYGDVKAEKPPSSGKFTTEDLSSPPKFPLIVFSHGLGGTRTTSSSLCGAFASYGFIVISMEHRDGSAVRTFVRHPDDNKLSDAVNSAIDHTRRELDQGFDRIDYIFPQKNKRDTDPHHVDKIDIELRKAQIQMRKAEIKELKRIMTIIHDGRGAELAKQNLRIDRSTGQEGQNLESIDWTSWKGRFHLKQATMIGHSFGAATAIQVLRDNENFPDFTQGIALDPWAAVVPPVDDGKISVPLLTINSEAFMWWQDNFDAAKKVASEAAKDNNLSWLMTVRGTIHLSQTDFPILYPRICSSLLKMTSDARRAVEITLNASLEFLRLVMPERISAINRGKQEGFLTLNITHELPEDHRPNDRWIGMRLKIPHELSTRLKSRKQKVKKDQTLDQEVWMHCGPRRAEIKAYEPGDVLD